MVLFVGCWKLHLEMWLDDFLWGDVLQKCDPLLLKKKVKEAAVVSRVLNLHNYFACSPILHVASPTSLNLLHHDQCLAALWTVGVSFPIPDCIFI